MKPGTRPLGRVNPRAGFNNYAQTQHRYQSNLRIDLENGLVLIPGSLDQLFLLKQYYLFLFFYIDRAN